MVTREILTCPKHIQLRIAPHPQPILQCKPSGKSDLQPGQAFNWDAVSRRGGRPQLAGPGNNHRVQRSVAETFSRLAIWYLATGRAVFKQQHSATRPVVLLSQKVIFLVVGGLD